MFQTSPKGRCDILAELRYNPILKDWVMIASHRQNRPQMPKTYCPFCPGLGRVPDPVAFELFQTYSAYGKCEVILDSKTHFHIEFYPPCAQPTNKNLTPAVKPVYGRIATLLHQKKKPKSFGIAIKDI
jgi:galactose-1-phosphate uridylyltransferase